MRVYKITSWCWIEFVSKSFFKNFIKTILFWLRLKQYTGSITLSDEEAHCHIDTVHSLLGMTDGDDNPIIN